MKNFKQNCILFMALFAVTISFAQGAVFSPTQLFLQFDDRPDQITWEIRSANAGILLRSGGPYSLGNANNLVAITLDDQVFGAGARFTFIIRDSGNDGLDGGAWAINTKNLTPVTSNSGIGERIVNGQVGFGSQLSVNFKNTDRTDIPSGPNTIGNVLVSDFSKIVTGGGGNNGGNNCSEAKWKANATYKRKDKVKHQNKVWRWKSKNRGNCTPGECGRWKNLGACKSSSDGDISSTNIDNIQVYQNSDSKLLNINLAEVNGIVDITIIDLQGKIVLKTSKSDNSNIYTVNTSSLKTGLYIVKVKNGEELFTNKLILN